jgi:beta-lactam-binding protein with PASTA domain
VRKYAIAAAVALAVLAIYAVVQLARVPDVRGTTYAGARDKLSAVGFKVVATSASGQYGEPLDLEIVSAQQPAAGSWRPVGSAVTLKTRIPRERVVVPDVVGKRVSDAEAAMRNAGLTLDTGGFIADNGVIASTIPTPGANVRFGSRVIYTLQGQ